MCIYLHLTRLTNMSKIQTISTDDGTEEEALVSHCTHKKNISHCHGALRQLMVNLKINRGIDSSQRRNGSGLMVNTTTTSTDLFVVRFSTTPPSHSYLNSKTETSLCDHLFFI